MIYSVVSFVIDKTSVMKRLLGVLLLVILIFTSCIDSTLDGVNSTRDFSATIVGDIYGGLEECDIAWEKSDQLTIFSRTTINRKYQIKNLNRGGSTAKFEYCGSVEGASLPLSNIFIIKHRKSLFQRIGKVGEILQSEPLGSDGRI